MRVELSATIDIGEAGGYRSSLEAPQPTALRASRPLAFELVANGWRGVTVIDGSPEDCDLDLAAHLQALIASSRDNPSWRFSITIEPDGGHLELKAGAFSEMDPELEALLSLGARAPRMRERGLDRMYVSVRLPADAHQHFLDLALKDIPSHWPPPVTEPSPGAIALGFELERDPVRTAQLISMLRMAWLTEGSNASCLVEVEGATPVVQEIDSLRAWSELERAIRAAEVVWEVPAPRPTTPRASRDLITRGVGVPALGSQVLTWLDEQERIRGLTSDGSIWDLPERTELVVPPATYIRRRDGSSVYTFYPAKGVEVPRGSAIARRAHFVAPQGVVFTDTQGDYAQVCVVAQRGVACGPLLRSPIGIVGTSDVGFAFAVSELGGAPAFVTIELSSMGWDYRSPWPEDAAISDLVLLPTTRTVVVVGTGHAYIIDAYTGELRRTVYLPCADPMIVNHGGDMVWVVGRAITGPARHDLIKISLGSGRTSILTAGINTDGWGALDALHTRGRWLLAFAKRGLFAFENDVVEALCPLGDGVDSIELKEWDGMVALFAATGHQSTRIVVGDTQFQTVDVSGLVHVPALEKR